MVVLKTHLLGGTVRDTPLKGCPDCPLTASEEMMTKMSDEPDRKIVGVIAAVDGVAREMERRWGVNRLLTSCPDPVLRERMERQLEKFNSAVWETRDPAEVAAHGDGVVKGWRALERAAMDAGIEELAVGRQIETRMADGSVLIIVPTADAYVRPDDEEREVTVISAEAVAALVKAQGDVVDAVVKNFPGAIIEAARPIDWDTGDEIGF